MKLFTKKNTMVVGRGATGIYLILASNFKSKKVLLPANICYAAVYPVLFSGNYPVFCDVDPLTGNMTLSSIKQCTENISVIIVPHMYGNPVEDIEQIKSYCQSKNILLIEDCASAMGAMINDSYVGSFGDYAIYSTGYSKTIDLGNGGIVSTDFSLSAEKNEYSKLPLFSPIIEKSNGFFSKEYRTFRNSGLNFNDSGFSKLVKSDLSSNYLYRLSGSFEENLYEELENLEDIISTRRRKLKLYDDIIRFDNISLRNYKFRAGSVPWRKNIFIDSALRSKFVQKLLLENIPVSDWYPVVSKLFDDNRNYPNALKMEQEILNFPLLISDEEVIHIANTINDILNTMSR